MKTSTFFWLCLVVIALVYLAVYIIIPAAIIIIKVAIGVAIVAVLGIVGWVGYLIGKNLNR